MPRLRVCMCIYVRACVYTYIYTHTRTHVCVMCLHPAAWALSSESLGLAAAAGTSGMNLFPRVLVNLSYHNQEILLLP